MAVDDINANQTMLTNYDLSLDIKDGKCEPDVVMKMFIDIIRTKAISRFSSTVGVLGKTHLPPKVIYIKQILKVLLVQTPLKPLLVFPSIIAQLL